MVARPEFSQGRRGARVRPEFTAGEAWRSSALALKIPRAQSPSCWGSVEVVGPWAEVDKCEGLPGEMAELG